MVLLTMTSAVVEALRELEDARDAPAASIGGKENDNEAENTYEASESTVNSTEKQKTLATSQSLQGEKEPSEPILTNAKIGNPISHGQILDIAKRMKTIGQQPHSLETLLKGAKVYIAPPPLKPEPTSEYKALMARLRRDEEARSYDRMTNPPPPMETFNQRFPASSAARVFSDQQNIKSSDPDDDGLTFADVDKQMALILNVLLSIVACAAAIWIAARWWSTPARLALSMSGSILVGVAEVVVYSGYIRRVGEAKGKEKAVKEVKEVINTWTVGAGQDEEPSQYHDQSVMIETKDDDTEIKARKRRNDQS